MARETGCSVNNFLITFVAILQFVLSSSNLFKESFMYGSPLCDMDDRLTRGCARIETDTQGLIHCSLKCNLNDTCVGASIDEEDTCYLHQECPGVGNACNVHNTNYRHVNKHCANGGRWLTSENRCQCIDGMVGKSCEDHPKNCSVLQSHGYGTDYHKVFLDLNENTLGLIKATCNLKESKPITRIVVLSTNGRKNFNLTWREYRDGFDIDADNFWIGLETIHMITRLGVYRFVLDFSLQLICKYKDFKISDEMNGYSVDFTDTAFTNKKTLPGNTFGDCLGNIKNISFSTWDEDNDEEDNENCASDVGSGWWFSNCDSRCNLFGYYPTIHGIPHRQQLRVTGIKNETYQTYENEFLSIKGVLNDK